MTGRYTFWIRTGNLIFSFLRALSLGKSASFLKFQYVIFELIRCHSLIGTSSNFLPFNVVFLGERERSRRRREERESAREPDRERLYTLCARSRRCVYISFRFPLVAPSNFRFLLDYKTSRAEPLRRVGQCRALTTCWSSPRQAYLPWARISLMQLYHDFLHWSPFLFVIGRLKFVLAQRIITKNYIDQFADICTRDDDRPNV